MISRARCKQSKVNGAEYQISDFQDLIRIFNLASAGLGGGAGWRAGGLWEEAWRKGAFSAGGNGEARREGIAL